MAKIITNKKGLDLNLKGKAPLKTLETKPVFTTYAIEPDNYIGLLPKVLVKEGDKVKAGDPVLCHKKNTDLVITSPVSGEVIAVNRGDKRKLLSVEIKSDSMQTYKEFDVANANTLGREKLLSLLLESGMMSFVRQRPYDRIVENTGIAPRDIFVTANFTAPLAPSFSFLSEGMDEDFQTALSAMAKLTDGKVFLGVEKGTGKTYTDVEQIEIHGPHPSGLVGTLINKTKPINKEETVWTMKATDLLVIGRFLRTGKVDYTRKIAVTGSSAKELGYINIIPGVKLSEVFPSGCGIKGEHERVIDGDVFTGIKFDSSHQYLSMQTDQITVIPEGDDVDEMFGWALPGFGKFSMSRSYFSWLMPKSKEYVLDARIKGGKRAMIMSHELNKTFAIDTYPEYLLKSIIAFNITDMENRGIYEVAPEDFCVCEFVDTSKMPLQDIVRRGLDALYKEMN